MNLDQSHDVSDRAFGRIWTKLESLLRAIVAIVLFTMMTVTFFDVIGRYLLAKPIPGGFEIVQYLMAFVVMASLPVTTAHEGHITVSMFTSGLTGISRHVHRFFVLLLSGVGMFLIVWRLGTQARSLGASKLVSGYLKLPLDWIAWGMTVAGALAFAVIVFKLVALLLGKEIVPPSADIEGMGVD